MTLMTTLSFVLKKIDKVVKTARRMSYLCGANQSGDEREPCMKVLCAFYDCSLTSAPKNIEVYVKTSERNLHPKLLYE